MHFGSVVVQFFLFVLIMGESPPGHDVWTSEHIIDENPEISDLLSEIPSNPQDEVSEGEKEFTGEDVNLAFAEGKDSAIRAGKLSYLPLNYGFNNNDDKSQRIKRSAEGCKVIERGGMKCTICTDATGGQTKSCASGNERSDGEEEDDENRRKRGSETVMEDPYEYVKSGRAAYKSRPKEFDHSYYNTREDEEEPRDDDDKDMENYGFDPTEYGFEKSMSEKEGEKLMKEGKNCQIVNRDGMTCTVCLNPEGGNFEQCSYSVEPEEQKYAYVKESKFDGNNKPTVIKEKFASNNGEQNQPQEQQEVTVEVQNAAPVPEVETSQPVQEQPLNPQLPIIVPSEQNPHFYYTKFPASHPQTSYQPQINPVATMESAASENLPQVIEVQHPQQQQEIVEAVQMGDDEEERNVAEDEEETSEEMHGRNEDGDFHEELFGDVYDPGTDSARDNANRNARNYDDSDYFQTDESKKDVEKVFAEFIKKDRSNCKQVRKKGMTCYLCLDSRGIQNEECMYISESQPKSSLMAFHEMQHIPHNPMPMQPMQYPQQAAAASTLVENYVKYSPTDAGTTNSKPVKRSIYNRKSKTPKKYNYERDLSSAASENDEEEIDEERNEDDGRDNISTEERQKMKREDEPQPEFDMNDEEGLFKEETRPVYSKTLGYSLPRFMVERSEHEASYDEFVRGARRRG